MSLSYHIKIKVKAACSLKSGCTFPFIEAAPAIAVAGLVAGAPDNPY
jgi:hypothetical protein